MNAAPETPRDATADIACPRCGALTTPGDLGGLCPPCFAHSALDSDTGWLVTPAGESGTDDAWPSVPGWTITGILGAGGMGRVYRAESLHDGTGGAVKVLESRWSRDPLMAERFEAEAHALLKLHHPHIVRVLETNETDDGRFCLVMELVEGCDLERLLRAEKLTAARAIDIFGKVCSAVAYAHEQGFAHRDIKPANILAAHDGTVKLADFGLAKDIGPGAGSTIGALTATTEHFGTAYYLAPERILSPKSAGPPADIYALGVLLYHLLAGQMPLGNYTPLSKITGLPTAFDRSIASALEADPARRTISAKALADEVAEAWRKHQHGAHRSRKWRRIRIVAAVAALAAVTAAGGAIWQKQHMAPPPPPVFAKPADASKEHPWENSLGMKFVPVPGTRVLFSVWETRRQDVEPFISAEKSLLNSSWRAASAKRAKEGILSSFYTLEVGGKLMPIASWNNLGYPVAPDHPACFLTVFEARRFCDWLTWKELSEGRLTPRQRYRLPEDAEWQAAAGGKGAQPRKGNVAGPEARDERWPQAWRTFSEPDPFPRSAPVGSFPAEPFGLYDISGNVTEWVSDDAENSNEAAIRLRGPAFNDGTPASVSFGFVRALPNKMRLPNIGFRIVLDWQDEVDEEE